MGNSLRRYGVWVAVALVGAVCWGVLALSRGETINAGWLLFAAIASYAIGYRFYARFIQTKVLEADDSRATPAERLNNGRDFEPMDRRVLFGHHFAAIAGAVRWSVPCSRPRWASCPERSGSSSASSWPAPCRI
jgi:carbon starvation protein